MPKIRTYLDVVPESVKEDVSREWGERKKETMAFAKEHGIEIGVGESFNKVVTFSLSSGYYHMFSGITSIADISALDEVKGKVSELIARMAHDEARRGCVPLMASNLCDWDSGYAKSVGASRVLSDAIISACAKDRIILTGGETANLGDQMKGKGMGWMFTLLSRYDGKMPGDENAYGGMDLDLQETFGFVADRGRFGIVNCNGMPLLHVKNPSKFIITADGSGSKSIVCDNIEKRTDIYDTLASAGDDPTRDGAFPVVASIGVHAGSASGKAQMLGYMKDAARSCMLPLVGSVFDTAPDVYTYTLNGTVLSEVVDMAGLDGKGISPGLSLVILYERQRTNGITLQRRVLEEAFGKDWHGMKLDEAIGIIEGELGDGYASGKIHDQNTTLGEMVALPSTPYFRIDHRMPRSIMETVKLKINVSSGGLVGKTRRCLEPMGIGAEYSNLFEAPDLVLLVQMSSRLRKSGGRISDEVSYHTWGCGVGYVIGTSDPEGVVAHYTGNGIRAVVGGSIIAEREIRVSSKGLDSMDVGGTQVLRYRYTDRPLG